MGATEATTFNRWRVWDREESRWMHIGYDTRSTARTAALKMNRAAGRLRYTVKRTEGR